MLSMLTLSSLTLMCLGYIFFMFLYAASLLNLDPWVMVFKSGNISAIFLQKCFCVSTCEIQCWLLKA